MFLSFPLYAETNPFISLGGFIDTYYAIDSNNPKKRERADFQTQPAKHNEFNLNLAYMEVLLKEHDRRGRLALQYGMSVDRNYAIEDNKSLQTIQEAFVGIKLSEELWLDAGIFFSHIGFESFISKDNISYTRSLNADNVPYYASGVRLEYQINRKDFLVLHLLNGWQNIQENNNGKAFGLKYQRNLADHVSLIYNNFFGDEKVTTSSSRFRSYHNFIYEKRLSEDWKLQSSLDIGTQAQEDNDGTNSWYATSIVLGQRINEVSDFGYRLEYYLDSEQSNVVTHTNSGFQVMSASINYDRFLARDTKWRTEIRGFYSKDDVFPEGEDGLNRWNGLLVTSLAVSF